MNKTITFAIATLELIEDGLRKIIASSDQLQEKLELHKVAVAAAAHAKHVAYIEKLRDAIDGINVDRHRAIALVNAAAHEAKARVLNKRDVALGQRADAFDNLVVVKDEYVSKATARGWPV